MKNHYPLLLLLFLLPFTIIKAGNSLKKENEPIFSFQKQLKVSRYALGCFDERTHLITIGVGVGGGDKYYKGAKEDSAYTFRTSPAYHLTYEHAIKSRIGHGYLGIGAYLGTQKTHYTFFNRNNFNGYYYEHKWKHYMIAVRSAYHWELLNSASSEIYFGALVGARIQNYTYSTNDITIAKDNYKLNLKPLYPTYSVFVGARWYIGSVVAIFAEAGYGISYFTMGLSFKF